MEAALVVAVEGAEALQVVFVMFGELWTGWQPFGFQDWRSIEHRFFFRQ